MLPAALTGGPSRVICFCATAHVSAEHARHGGLAVDII